MTTAMTMARSALQISARTRPDARQHSAPVASAREDDHEHDREAEQSHSHGAETLACAILLAWSQVQSLTP